MWTTRRPPLESEKEDAEPVQTPQRRRKTKRRANPHIGSEAGVEGDASDDGSDGDNDWLILLYLMLLNINHAPICSVKFIHALYIYNPHVFIICTCTIQLGVVC